MTLSIVDGELCIEAALQQLMDEAAVAIGPVTRSPLPTLGPNRVSSPNLRSSDREEGDAGKTTTRPSSRDSSIDEHFLCRRLSAVSLQLP